ncbi:hypothetical protein [Glaesserella sp.]|uniref:hypothetical protein n=1 Tax=Glaesserella sp. TaxID=2094731 RepID=UPI0035A0446A
MAIQTISVKDIIILSQCTEITAKIPQEIQQFFDDNFDYLQWEWSEKQEFWLYLDNFYPKSMDYQSNIIYLDEDACQKKQQLIESLAWIIKILQYENADLKELQIAFELVCIVPNFWEITAQENIRFSIFAKNTALKFLKNINFEISSLLDSSRYDIEYIEKLKQDLENHHWVELEKSSHTLESIYSNLSLNFHRTYSFLCWYHLEDVIALINEEKNYWKLLWLLANLPEKNRLRIILDTSNQLACFLLLIRRMYHLSEEEQLNLSEVWKNLSSLEETLKEWLSVVNQYPVRFPWLQLGLGKFLTIATNQEINYYIESINLESSSTDIKKCVDYFFEHANETKQIYFCEQAFQKWNQWDFNQYFGIRKSCLDKAIVKYFQFQSSDKLDGFIQDHLTKINTFQNKWFDNIVNLDKFIYYHLSKIQPACIACDLNNDNNLKFEDLYQKEYVPICFSGDLRWKNWVKYLDKT